MIRLFTNWRSLMVVVVIAAASIASGCGDDDDDDSNDGATASTEFTGPPVTIYTETVIKTQVGDAPEIPAAVSAAARAINEEGGLNGHEVKVEFCNDTDANAELACARKAISEDALAFSGAAFLFNPVSAQDALAKAKIANVAPLAANPVEYSQAINFPIDTTPVAGNFPCVTQAPEASGKETVGQITQDLPPQVAGATQIEAVAKGSGADYAGTVVVPISQTDFSAPVQEAVDNGTEVLLSWLAPAQLPALLQSATSLGEEFVYCLTAGSAPLQVLEQLGALASEFYVGEGLPPTTEATAEEHPMMQDFIDQMKAEEDAGNADASLTKGIPVHALRAWLGVQVIKQVSESITGELTSATLLDALNKATVDLGGLTPPLDFSKPVDAPGFERAFNPMVTLAKWDPDAKEFVETDQPPENALELVAAGG
jgi:ABC-type branched-subunit amino acid transport system substrate-binding protein